MINDCFIDVELPKPLTHEEILEHFKKYKNGDINSKEIIINHNIRLVIKEVTKKFNNTPYDKEELVSIGILGLVKSTDSFNPNLNIKFSTYAVRCINNEILMYLRKEKKHENNTSIQLPLATAEDGDELLLEDLLEDKSSDFVTDFITKESYKIINEIVKNMSERDKFILTHYFGLNKAKKLTQQQIADTFNVTQTYIARLLKFALINLKELLENEDIIEKKQRNNKSKQRKKTNKKN